MSNYWLIVFFNVNSAVTHIFENKVTSNKSNPILASVMKNIYIFL